MSEVTVRYINLKSRSDRNISIVKEFNEIGFVKYKRIPGVPLLNGALGCAMAHVNAIQDYLVSEENILIICEDDIIFDSNCNAVQELLNEFVLDKNLDILCIGNNVLSIPVRISDKLSIANNIQTASCYVVKKNVVPELLSTFTMSIERMKNGEDSRQAAIDIQWKKMQQNRIFAFPNEKIAIQGASFSNIENTHVEYKN